MTFEEVLDRAIAMLQRRGRVTSRTFKRQFNLDDAALEDLKEELIEAEQLAVDQDGKILVWIGDDTAAPGHATPESAVPPASAAARQQHQPPLAYTPAYLTEKILTSRKALEGERKQVTVLFADLKDSTEMIKDLDPEAAQQLLDPAIHIMMDAVHRFEGTVNQVLGDGIMALFGAPIAHEDHALRACYAALAMQAAMHPYADEVRRTQGLEMRIRVGLNSGEVVVRTIGNDLHMDYSAVGPTTHLAARMEQLAAPGSTRLSAATLRLVEGLVQVNALGPVPVKGMTDPVEVFELTGASTIRRRLQAAVARGLTRFVGRDTEIGALQRALEQARSGHGQVVAVVGEAGVGKSRLVYEFVQSHRTHGWLVLESASVSYGKATPYFPVVDLLKRYVHVEDGDAPRSIRAKVTGQLLTLDVSLRETIPALCFLLDALPEDDPFLRLDPPQRRQRTLDALTRMVLRESQVQPLLLVFEDLHWIDAETQAFLDNVIERLPTAQLLLLVNYRPEYQHRWGSKTSYTQLRLDALPPENAEALLAALLGNDPSLAPLKQLLIARSEGNPFFLEESVRTLVETKALVGTPGAYRLGHMLPEMQVPATVQAVLAARMDRLSPEDKNLLQTAAVIGTDVPFPLLQAIADIPEARLHASLSQLTTAEFLYETRLFPTSEYTFKHALTHDVAYGSLLQERRRVLHARIVAALEALEAERLTEHAERLAHHAFRGEVWDKAVTYARQAGAKATSRSVHREAVAYFEQALAALEHLPEGCETTAQAIDLRLDLFAPLYALREFHRIGDLLHQAEDLAQNLQDRQRLGRLSAYMARYLWATVNHERAVEVGQRACAIATELKDVALQAVANYTVAFAYHDLSVYGPAIDLLRQNLALLEGDLIRERLGQTSLPSVSSRVALAWCLGWQGEFGEATALIQEAARIAEAAGHLGSVTSALQGGGLLYLLKGDLNEAIPRLERADAVNQANQTPRVPATLSFLAHAYTLTGRVAEALPLFEQSLERAAAYKFLPCNSLWIGWWGEAALLAGRLEDAMQHATRAVDIARAQKEQGYEAYALRLLGKIAAHGHAPHVEQAATHYQQALARADALGMRPLQAHCHLDLGRLYSKTQRAGEARAELSTAIEMYRDMQMTFWLPQAEAALAEVDGPS
jgi:class 3 adenylate cyclase/tetratricopeptide (TPR) repeat protein